MIRVENSAYDIWKKTDLKEACTLCVSNHYNHVDKDIEELSHCIGDFYRFVGHYTS